MDWWIIISLLEFLVIGGGVFLMVTIARVLKQEEAERRKDKMKQLRGKGKRVKARVTRVIARGRMQYEIKAQWYGIETDNDYIFCETFWYYSGLLGMRPKVAIGDEVLVTVNFRAPSIYHIERPW